LEPLPKNFSTKGNLSGTIIKLANSLDITFRSSQWAEKFDWKGGFMSIKSILGNCIEYKKAIPSLRKRKIMYVDQILNKELDSILSWNFVQLLGNSTKGPKPSWYKETRNKIATRTDVLKSQWINLPWKDQEHEILSNRQEADGRRNNWYIIVDEENPELFTWVREKGRLNKEKLKNRHNNSRQHYSLFQNPRTGHAVLRRCEYCKEVEHNETAQQETCKISSKSKIQIFYCDLLNRIEGWRKKSALEIPVDCKYLEEEVRKQVRKSSKFLEKQPTESFLEVEIEDAGITIIQDNIETEEHKESLIKEYRANTQSNQVLDFQFYTDGSLGNTIEGEKRMGAAWLQTEGPNKGNSFAARITDWPSSCRAELAAIILAVLTVPQKSRVEIVTDSASCISTFNRLIKPDPKRTTRRWMKEKNWSLWMRLIEIIRRKKIQVNLKKVKAHSGEYLNDKVDRLAKEGRNLPEVNWKDPRHPIWSVLPIWNQLVVDISIREFIKEVHKKKMLVEWSQQNKIQKR
jgi:ribonuclease HI